RLRAGGRRTLPRPGAPLIVGDVCVQVGCSSRMSCKTLAGMVRALAANAGDLVEANIGRGTPSVPWPCKLAPIGGLRTADAERFLERAAERPAVASVLTPTRSRTRGVGKSLGAGGEGPRLGDVSPPGPPS